MVFYIFVSIHAADIYVHCRCELADLLNATSNARGWLPLPILTRVVVARFHVVKLISDAGLQAQERVDLEQELVRQESDRRRVLERSDHGHCQDDSS